MNEEAKRQVVEVQAGRSTSLSLYQHLGPEGGKALAVALQQCPNLTSLTLRRTSLGPEGGKALATALQDCRELTSLNISSNSLGTEGGKAIAAALQHYPIQHCPKLTSLNFSDNSLGPEGGKALTASLQHCPKLTSLDLGSNGLGAEGGRVVAAALQHCPELSSLTLSSNSLGAEGGKALAAAKLTRQHEKLTSLNLSSNSLDPEGGKAVAKVLKLCPKLSSLNLSSNSLGPEGGRAVALAFKSCPDLTSLDLDGNNLGPEDGKIVAADCPKLTSLSLRNNNLTGKAVAVALQHCPSLTSLNLSSNNLGLAGGQALAALKHCPNLTRLYLENDNLGLEGGKAVAALQHCPKLAELNLTNNNLGPESGQAVAAALQHCPRLTSLTLSNNKLGPEGVAAALQFCPKLASLYLSNNNLGSDLDSHESGQAMAKALQHCPKLTLLHLLGNNLGPEAVVAALEHCPDLRELRLDNNNLGTGGGGRVVAAALQHCPNLTRLDLDNNNLGPEGGQAVVAALQHFPYPIGLRLFLSGNNLGREDINTIEKILQDDGKHKISLPHKLRVEAAKRRLESAESIRATTEDKVTEVIRKHDEETIAADKILKDKIESLERQRKNAAKKADEERKRLEELWSQHRDAREAAVNGAASAVCTLDKERQDWIAKMAHCPLDKITPTDVSELLDIWGFSIPTSKVQEQGLNGVVLADLPESEMEETVGLDKWGDRRRLTQAVRALTSRPPRTVVPGPPSDPNDPRGWTVDRVMAWAMTQGFSDEQVAAFKNHGITGAVLVELTREDLPRFKFALAVDRTNAKRAIDAAAATAAAAAAADAAAVELAANQFQVHISPLTNAPDDEGRKRKRELSPDASGSSSPRKRKRRSFDSGDESNPPKSQHLEAAADDPTRLACLPEEQLDDAVELLLSQVRRFLSPPYALASEVTSALAVFLPAALMKCPLLQPEFEAAGWTGTRFSRPLDAGSLERLRYSLQASLPPSSH